MGKGLNNLIFKLWKSQSLNIFVAFSRRTHKVRLKYGPGVIISPTLGSTSSFTGKYKKTCDMQKYFYENFISIHSTLSLTFMRTWPLSWQADLFRIFQAPSHLSLYYTQLSLYGANINYIWWKYVIIDIVVHFMIPNHRYMIPAGLYMEPNFIICSQNMFKLRRFFILRRRNTVICYQLVVYVASFLYMEPTFVIWNVNRFI